VLRRFLSAIKEAVTTVGESDPRPDTYLAKLFHKPRYDEVTAIIKELAGDAIDVLVDVGGGRGALYEWLMRAGTNVGFYLCCDVDGGRLREASSEKVLCDAHHLPFRSRSIDVAVCSEVLEHLKQPLRALNNILEVSKRFVIVTFPDERVKNALGFRYPEHISEPRFEDVMKLAKAKGYALMLRKRLYYAFPPSIIDRAVAFSPIGVKFFSATLAVLSRLLKELCLIKTEIILLKKMED